MDRALYKATMTGNPGFLTEARVRELEKGSSWEEYLLTKTPQNNNILHISSLHNHVDFIRDVLTFLSHSEPIKKLIAQKNNEGDTPLHIASRKGNLEIVHLLVANVDGPPSVGEIKVVQEEGGDVGRRPWRVGNLDMNTPVHEALIYGRIDVAMYLVRLDDVLTSLVNGCKETPLHLAVQLNALEDKQLVIDTIELMNKQHASLTYKSSKCPTKQESSKIIQLLLNTNTDPLYMPDQDGLTPLLKAASVSNTSAIQLIITQFPETTETRDSRGQTILHYLVKIRNYQEAKTLLGFPQISCLKDEQDFMGNTPSFVAVKTVIDEYQSQMENKQSQIDFEMGMVKGLLASSANFTVKNKQGVSAAALIRQYNNLFSNITKVQLVEEFKADSTPSCSAVEEEKYKIRKAIHDENLVYLTQIISLLGKSLSYYGCLEDGNILHGVLKSWKTKKNIDVNNNDSVLNFIENVLEKFPSLLVQGDFKGDTPLHIMVRELDMTRLFLDKIVSYFERSQEELASEDEEIYCSPWKMRNMEGNAPIHEAMLNSQSVYEIVSLLINLDESVFALLNSRDETPLHVLCRRTDVMASVEEREQVTEQVITAYKLAAYIRDVDGLTPLLRASINGNITEVDIICRICPESAHLLGDQGRTFWHIIDLSKTSRDNEADSMDGLLENQQIKQLLYEKDDEGYTPVELAIKTRNYRLLKALKPCQDVFAEVEKILTHGDVETQLLLPTISCANYLPATIEQIVWDILKEVPRKSFFGVLESEISEYSQTLGLIAVLLATIAFTVPGGFRQEHTYLNNNNTSVPFEILPSGNPNQPNVSSDLIGTPVLLGSNLTTFLTRAAYWTFMISDIITMSLSTFVMYCLLWMMKNSEMKMVLIDICICSLQVCFFTVMITFMMGVFATTVVVEPAIAYMALGVCSGVMLLMNRWLIPTKSVLLFFAVAYEVFIRSVERNFNIRLTSCDKPYQWRVHKARETR